MAGRSEGTSLQDLLLVRGVVPQDVLNQALTEHDKTKESLLDILLKTGKVDEKKLVALLSKEFGYTVVNPAIFIIPEEIASLVPQSLSEKNTLLPVSLLERTLTVAFANPMNLKAIDELHALTGLRIKVVVAEAQILKRCIQKTYEIPQGQTSAGAPSLESQDNLDDLVRMIDEKQHEDGAANADLLKIAYETPVIKLVNMLLMEGVRRHASDIFVEPWENHVRVRARVDGLLEEIVRPQKALGPAIVSRIKVMSDLDIAEHRIPQDGRFKAKINGREIDMRVSILPTCHGEKVCLRILDTSSQSHDISKLGFNDKEQTIIKDSSRHPHGMILVTGPTGSGKTTTLYSVLKYLDAPEVNITTVEDPVEYQLPGINQVNVKEHIGLTFPAALRSILRQDPNVILIGEIRDGPTMDIAVKAALTGHLVLSTLHTNDAVSSVTRMINMGLEPFLIASTVLMISAQRLVRRLCSRCRVSEVADKAVLKSLGMDTKEPVTVYKGRGCIQCRQSGYKGRTVITEILQLTPRVKEMILAGASAESIKSVAIEEGMTTLRQCALRKALEGETTLEEVFRITSEDAKQKQNEEKKQQVGKAA